MNEVRVEGTIAYRPTKVPGGQGEVIVMGLEVNGCMGHITVVMEADPAEQEEEGLKRGDVVRVKGRLEIQELDAEGDGVEKTTVVVASKISRGCIEEEDCRRKCGPADRPSTIAWGSGMSLQEPEEVFEIAGHPFETREAGDETRR